MKIKTLPKLKLETGKFTYIYDIETTRLYKT